MTDFGMDTDALEEFGGRLARMLYGLEGARNMVDSYDSDYGDHRVKDAMHGFEKHWRDGRKHVKDTGGTLATMAVESVKAFRKLDDDLGKQLRDATKGDGKGDGKGQGGGKKG
ncbi:hypothetical protein [Streptomyces sp. NPDC059009]|uniref:hypothetical protein n=1 Tax=Streptomyces sp. NPDC059009 TaxID=3346694 RepID=UPI0036A9E7B5